MLQNQKVIFQRELNLKSSFSTILFFQLQYFSCAITPKLIEKNGKSHISWLKLKPNAEWHQDQIISATETDISSINDLIGMAKVSCNLGRRCFALPNPDPTHYKWIGLFHK